MINELFSSSTQIVHAIRDMFEGIYTVKYVIREFWVEVSTRRDTVFSRKKVEMIGNFSGNSFDVENVKNGKKIEETNVKSNKVF